MNFRQLLLACSVSLASLGAGAQMPAPVLADSADAGKQLETLLLCKPGTDFTAKDVQAHFRALGLALVKDSGGIFGIYMPSDGSKATLFGDEVLAVQATEALGEKKVSVYLKNQTGKQLAKKMSVTKIDDEGFYYKWTSKKTEIYVGSDDQLFVNNEKIVNYKSMLACRIMQSVDKKTN